MRHTYAILNEETNQGDFMFNQWLDTLIEEKEINTEEQFQVQGQSGTNFMCYENVIEAIKSTSSNEQAGIKSVLVKIDFANGDIKHYFRHLAQAIAL